MSGSCGQQRTNNVVGGYCSLRRFQIKRYILLVQFSFRGKTRYMDPLGMERQR